jgi:hypothetical protein
MTTHPVVGGGLSAARRHDGLDPTLVSRLPITALPTVHETFAVLIELARTDVPFTFTVTVPAQRVATGTPAVVEDGAQSAAAQPSARSRRRMSAILPSP